MRAIGHIITASAWLSACVIAVAGLLKLADVPDFSLSLRSWGFESLSLRIFLAILVPATELVFAGMWILNHRRAWAAWGLVLMIVVFTVVFCWLLLAGAAPSCRCFGLLSRRWELREHAPLLLVRNTAILFSLLAERLYWNSRGTGEASRSNAPSRATGFTLIELLLCVSLIAVLVSLLVPSAMRFKHTAARTQVLAILRQHGANVLAYTSDWRDTFPYFTDPAATATIIYPDGEPITLGYFDPSWSWHLAVSDCCLGLPWSSDSYTSGHGKPTYVTDFRYSSTFLADPAFWNPYTRTGPAQWRSIRLAEVLYPSDKAVHLAAHPYFDDLEMLGNRAPAMLSFSDGSAADVPSGKYTYWYLGGVGQWPQWQGNLHQEPGMCTIDGVRGRDRTP